MKKLVSLFLLIVLCLPAFGGCASEKVELKDVKIMHETKFGGIYFDCTIEDFNALGFQFGDSVDIVFSNGKKLEDQPYYNGYYVDIDESLLVGYPGYPYIEAAVNYGADPFLTLALDETVTATITLKERGKCLKIQNARNISYSDEQGEKSDVVFGNFRASNVGNLKKDVLYRAASPCNNEHKRAAVVDRLCKEAGISFMLNLSDGESDLQKHIEGEDFSSPWFLSLYERGCVAPLGLSANFKSESFETKLAAGLTKMSESDGPYLVHCVEGKDRTGYVIMLLEALCGASYGEIVDDYMLTYDNYYGINRTSDPERWQIIKEKNLDVMIAYMTGETGAGDLEKADLGAAAEALLLRIGMTESAVAALKNKLTGR